MAIRDNLSKVKKELPDHVTLVAVSKTKPVSDLMEAYDQGQRVFGENKVQEMVSKYEAMPKDIVWHMIGHLQRNKVKYMAGFVKLIHGIDSLKLLQEVDKQAEKHNRVIDCLLQIKIAKETSKFGMTKDDANELLRSETFSSFKNVNVIGVMGMSTFTEDETIVRAEFNYLKTCYDELKKEHPIMNTISMGMSGDYKLAIECGSTMVRVGSSIFGARNYH